MVIDWSNLPQEGNDEWYAHVLTKRWYHCTPSWNCEAIERDGLDSSKTQSSTDWLHLADEPLYSLVEMHLFYEEDESLTVVGYEVDIVGIPRERVTPGFDDMESQLAISGIIEPSRLRRLP